MFCCGCVAAGSRDETTDDRSTGRTCVHEINVGATVRKGDALFHKKMDIEKRL